MRLVGEGVRLGEEGLELGKDGKLKVGIALMEICCGRERLADFLPPDRAGLESLTPVSVTEDGSGRAGKTKGGFGSGLLWVVESLTKLSELELPDMWPKPMNGGVGSTTSAMLVAE